MVYPMQVKFEETAPQSTFKYLEGAPEICRCSAAKPPSPGACGPGPSRPAQAPSSAADQPSQIRTQQAELITELHVRFSWLELKMASAWQRRPGKSPK